jgi:RNA polymerase sigma-70 factor (ECF subfamily)
MGSKLKSNLPALVSMLGLYCVLAMPSNADQTVDSLPPVVVKTIPESGTKDVPAGITEIRITFSKDMADRSWSFCEPWAGANAAMIDGPAYQSDKRTVVVKVRLEPAKTYAYWLNTERFQNFRDQTGNPAVPYLLVFQTSAK